MDSILTFLLIGVAIVQIIMVMKFFEIAANIKDLRNHFILNNKENIKKKQVTEQITTNTDSTSKEEGNKLVRYIFYIIVLIISVMVIKIYI